MGSSYDIEDGVGRFTAMRIEFSKPPAEKKDRREAGKLRRVSIERYGLCDSETPAIWCPILGKFCEPPLITAGHIVPRSLGKSIVDYLFGEAMSQFVDEPQNVLAMNIYLERQFDQYAFVLVPVDPSEVPLRRWNIIVIKDDHRDESLGLEQPTLGDIDGRELKFRNEQRPMSRFLHFHFLTALIIVHQQDPTGRKKIEELAAKRHFAGFEKWMRTAPIIRLVGESGERAPELVRLLVETEHHYPGQFSETADDLGEAEKEEMTRRLRLSLYENPRVRDLQPPYDDQSRDEDDEESDDE